MKQSYTALKGFKHKNINWCLNPSIWGHAPVYVEPFLSLPQKMPKKDRLLLLPPPPLGSCSRYILGYYHCPKNTCAVCVSEGERERERAQPLLNVLIKDENAKQITQHPNLIDSRMTETPIKLYVKWRASGDESQYDQKQNSLLPHLPQTYNPISIYMGHV